MDHRDEDGLYLWRRGQRLERNGPLVPQAPAIVLICPKYPHNVAMAVRNASCWGIPQVWYTGNRVDLTGDHFRLPREERMKGYDDVTLINHPTPIAEIKRAVPEAVPVAVELRPGSECIYDFDHPSKAIYVFGPEDGSLQGPVLKQCHRFIVFPTQHCLNLANSVTTVLYDRNLKSDNRFDVGKEQRVVIGR